MPQKLLQNSTLKMVIKEGAKFKNDKRRKKPSQKSPKRCGLKYPVIWTNQKVTKRRKKPSEVMAS